MIQHCNRNFKAIPVFFSSIAAFFSSYLHVHFYFSVRAKSLNVSRRNVLNRNVTGLGSSSAGTEWYVCSVWCGGTVMLMQREPADGWGDDYCSKVNDVD